MLLPEPSATSRKAAPHASGAAGQPSKQIDLTSPPASSGQISVGETWFFSLWFRDPSGGPAGFNFADGLRATFCP